MYIHFSVSLVIQRQGTYLPTEGLTLSAGSKHRENDSCIRKGIRDKTCAESHHAVQMIDPKQGAAEGQQQYTIFKHMFLIIIT